MAIRNSKKGLGKGLDSLIPMGSEIENITKPVKKAKNEPKTNENGVIELKVNQIEPNREQPRKNFDEDALQELADSIKKHGIIQPLVVQKKGEYYEIIAGERRWRAAKIAGLKHIPVVIKDYSEQEMVEIALIENIQRQDLNPIEEAMAFKQLMQEYDLKQDELAERVSKSRTAVTNSMRLLKLPQKIMEMVINNELSSGHARTLLSIEDEDLQIKVAELVILKQMSVRETENYVKKLQNNKNKSKDTKNTDNDFVYRDIENRIKEIVGTKVKVNHKNNGKGKIEIEFYSDDELERIYDLFLKTQN
ncbi:MAG: ParB/RepB/Spo0J family partition protein [Lachnospiraceae bacterium]|nr:ParB/RepB/Spo0J family partition protein [Lachnospiraceae bacterium]